MKYGKAVEKREFTLVSTTRVEVTGTLEECRLDNYDEHDAVVGLSVRTTIYHDSGTPEIDVHMHLQPLNRAGTLVDGRKPVHALRIYRGDPWYDIAMRECITE